MMQAVWRALGLGQEVKKLHLKFHFLDVFVLL